MAYNLNEKLIHLEPYEVDTAEYKIRLDANESFLAPPQNVLTDMLTQIARVNINRYPSMTADIACEAFADYYSINSEFVTAGNGSDELLFVINNTFLSRGQKVMIATPDFSMYGFYASLAECEICEYKKSADLQIDPDVLIAQANREKCDMLLFSNPCNPTSLGLCREDVRKIIRNVSALVVLDEAYMDFWDQSLITEAAEYDNLILLRTCSKMMGLASIRLGFAVANWAITKALRAAKSPYNVNALSQAAGAAVLQNKVYINSCRGQILACVEELYLALSALGYEKGFTVFETKTNFVFVELKNAQEVFEQLKKEGILVRHFGSYLRITVGSKDENAILIAALTDILSR